MSEQPERKPLRVHPWFYGGFLLIVLRAAPEVWAWGHCAARFVRPSYQWPAPWC